MTTVVNKPNGTGIGRIIKATKCSYYGFKAAWQHESAFRQELLLVMVLLPLSFLLCESRNHWLLLFASLMLVLFAELINSAIEAVADAVSLEYHTLIGRAKDIGSAVVFIALTVLVVVWGDAVWRIIVLQQ
ncbi:diacylglycerol kinase [Paraglaciecola hydrolytica]|uniref:Diacylglycerol kinase n=1 Tax=Paraglaciecola hydrolytica TaxID=1799789 RepID=A0A135ZZ76_9ALTE|nr:diacylglycerol kinase [Paraglaciecola hydrolytica]KXI28283.1 diacylglycerol kinase [Paraglaciecola hydrolytica]